MIPAEFYFHSLFGLHLRSNKAIPAFEILAPPPSVDVEIWFDREPPACEAVRKTSQKPCYISSICTAHGQPVTKAWRSAETGQYRMLDSNGIEFIIDQIGTQVWVQQPEWLSFQVTVHRLIFSVMTFILRLRSRLCLGGAVVSEKDMAFSLLGGSYAGKSTNTAVLAAQGYRVLSDDLLVLSEENHRFVAYPGYPWLCLRPFALRMIYGSFAERPHLSPSWIYQGETYVSLNLRQNGYPFQCTPLPLTAIYILGPRRDDAVAPWIKPISKPEALLNLLTHSWNSPLLGKDVLDHDYAQLSRLVALVPVFQVTPHSDPARLSQLCEAITRHFATVTSSKDL